MTNEEKLQKAEGYLRQSPALWYMYEAETRKPLDIKGILAGVIVCVILFLLALLYGTSGREETPSVISKPTNSIIEL